MSNILKLPSAKEIESVRNNLPAALVRTTPLELNQRLSTEYGAEIWIKDESKQGVRSYKVRGATNALQALSPEERERGVVCASAGNHAQGFAAACNTFGIHGYIFMPKTTPPQKIEATQRFGGNFITIKQVGDTFDEASAAARAYEKISQATFIHPFDDPNVIAGQGTVAVEIISQMARGQIDRILVPVGGGGLLAGTAIYCAEESPETMVIGIEPKEAAAMDASIKAGRIVSLEKNAMSRFVDGAAVLTPGELTFEAARRHKNVRIQTVPENRVCTTMLDMYNREGTVVEPAGVLSIDALKDMRNEIRGKIVVCILSGGNFDMARMSEVIERSRVFEGQQRYVRVTLPDRPGALKELLRELPQEINITRMRYNEVPGANASLELGLRSNDPSTISRFLGKIKDDSHGVEEVGSPLLTSL